MIEVQYKLPVNGLGTNFAQSDRPLSFAQTYTNRFRNEIGHAEKRPGLNKLNQNKGAASLANLTRLHEWVSNTGEEVLMTSDDSGNIYRFNASASSWDSVLTGKAATRQISAQAEEYLIFCNGTDRNYYTKDGGDTWRELKALITQGTLTGGSNTTTVIDANITNWIGNTLVANNDIVYNVTQGGYGIVTGVASAALTITAIASVAVCTGAGVTLTGQNQQSGDVYQLIDYLDLNIIPQADGSLDNIATTASGTTTSVIAVSGVNFADTEIRPGDFVYNTTRASIAIVGSVSANINFSSTGGPGGIQQLITTQAVGDSIAFFKSAMPIASWVHVHYGRVYMIDSRNQTRVVITAPDDPQDVTTFQQTLNSTSFSFGTQQPAGDALLTLSSFQQYFVAAGKRNLYIYRGITPIQDGSGTVKDFTPISFYPNGTVSRFGLNTNGTDLLYITKEGLQAVNIGANVSYTTVQNNVSLPIRDVLLDLISQTQENDIQVTFYPRRQWILLKVGTSVYVLNTAPSYDETGAQQSVTSWHLFAGKWAQLNHYFVNRSGDLIGCGANGQAYYLDSSATTDDGEVITTALTTAWLRMEEPQRTPRIKKGLYIRPIFESAPNIDYTISVVAGWDNFSSDEIIVSSGNTGGIGSQIIGTTPIGQGTYVQADKYPFRWRGEQARIQFVTNTSAAPDIITGFYLYGNIGGVR